MSLSTSRASRPTPADVRDAFLQACGEEGIIAEYRLLGVNFVDDKPRANGYMECYALGREDATPSACVCPATGKYKDSKAGREVDIWQVAADHDPRHGGDWQAAREHYLSKVGLSFKARKSSGRRSSSRKPAGSPYDAAALVATRSPSTNGHTPASRKPKKNWLEAFRPERDSHAARRFVSQFAIMKAGFTRESFMVAGGFYSTFPHDERPREDGTPQGAWQHIVGLPVYGQSLLTAETIDDTTGVGAVIWNKNARPFEITIKGKDEPDKVKMRTDGSADGLIGRHGIQLILDDRRRVAAGLPSQIDRIWKVEGPTDLLALWCSMSDDRRSREPIISTAGGSTSVYYWMAELIRGYDVVVCHDLDDAGDEGANKTCEVWGPAAKSISIIKLPGEHLPKHGLDLRDCIIGGLSFDEIGGMFAPPTTPFDVTDDLRAAFAARLAGEGEGLLATSSAVDSSASPQADSDSDLAPNEAADDPHRLARNYVEKYATVDSPSGPLVTIRRWREEWHRWDGGQYRQFGEADLKDSLNRSIKEEFDRLNLIALDIFNNREITDENADDEPPFARKVSRTLVADAAAAMAGEHALSSDRDAPFWIDESDPAATPFPANEIFATGSGLFHLKSLFAVNPENPDDAPVFQIPPSPNFFSPNAVTYGFPNNDIRQCPTPTKWLAFLRSLWGDDLEQIELLQEWMGYCLLPDTSQQKIMLLIGPPRSGKGTICRVLTELVGELNVVNPRLSSFGTEFGIEPLVGKTLGIVSDARLSGRSDIAQIVETLLSISGEDKQTVRRMYKSHINTRLRLRFMIVSNELPALQDASGAFLNRCMLLQTSNTFLGAEDKNLEASLRDELPGILVWAAQGWLHLKERGYFQQPESSRELFNELYSLTSPIKAFIEDCCDVDRERSCLVSDLYTAYRKWCEEQGRHPSNKQEFGKNLHASLPHVATEQVWNAGNRQRAFVGVILKPFLT